MTHIWEREREMFHTALQVPLLVSISRHELQVSFEVGTEAFRVMAMQKQQSGSKPKR